MIHTDGRPTVASRVPLDDLPPADDRKTDIEDLLDAMSNLGRELQGLEPTGAGFNC